MAAILRSSVIQTVRRRAFSDSAEGAFSARALHSARNRAKSAKVDPLYKKTDDIAKKELVVGYSERLGQELKSIFWTPRMRCRAFQCLFSMSVIGAYMLGCQLGSIDRALAQNSQASSKHEDLSSNNRG